MAVFNNKLNEALYLQQRNNSFPSDFQLFLYALKYLLRKIISILF